ncbi:uroporphyrinogen-III C-methyltransferase [Vibrio sp. DNF-1]|nr:uroporphyrinogen-III C-methyltransferase [Vibrio salinus]MCE0496204.1 uroporphyrinogen-III C-methyltransferase [Vibrio salinus]
MYEDSTVSASGLSGRSDEKGRVCLVGAGPGDPDLLTVKALRLIENAEVVVFDRLVGKDILALCHPDADMIYAGKRCGRQSMKQETISQLLVDLALSGKNVIRLKGGDPFIFGRGGEEALLLAENGIQYEVVPGVTAAIGCSASALIPLTHRKVSRSVTFVTGHVVSGAMPAWAGLVHSGQTLVFYMGLEKANAIQSGLYEAGLSLNTPVAVVGKGCSKEQEVHTFQLNELKSMAVKLAGLSPALIIIGQVVTLRTALMTSLNEIKQMGMM